ncbi:MAG: LysR family transcriptional regulator [Lachnospiraceae bacterium]|nr:LysR family transcriptional regulator [Lachnospiraceae bacterium]
MNWQHLVYFQSLAKTQNYAQASKELYISPSTLSKAITSLEEELGFPLFLKSGRNSILSEYGKEFKEYVDQSITCIEHGIQNIHAKMNQISGPLTICGIYVLCSDYLPPIVKAFLSQYPNVNITLEHQISIHVIERVLFGKSDLGFCADFNFHDKKYSSLAYTRIKQDNLIFITSLNHPLAAKTAVSLEQLKDEDFILNGNPDTRNRIDFLNLCKEHQFTPKITFEPADDQSIIGMVYAGLGISCMANIPSVHRGNLHVLNILEDHVPVQSYYMIWRKDAHLSLAAKAFKDYVLSSLDTPV